MYDPRVGRWLSIDPIVHEWESPYVGFANDPINLSDPSGESPTNNGGGTGHSPNTRCSGEDGCECPSPAPADEHVPEKTLWRQFRSNLKELFTGNGRIRVTEGKKHYIYDFSSEDRYYQYDKIAVKYNNRKKPLIGTKIIDKQTPSKNPDRTTNLQVYSIDQKVTDDQKYIVTVKADNEAYAVVSFKVDGKFVVAGTVDEKETKPFTVPNGATEIKIKTTLSRDAIDFYKESSLNTKTEGEGPTIMQESSIADVYKVIPKSENGRSREIYYRRAFGMRLPWTKQIHNHLLSKVDNDCSLPTFNKTNRKDEHKEVILMDKMPRKTHEK